MVALEARLKIPIPTDHPLLAWAIEHAAYVLNKYQIGPDNRTPWGRLHGRETAERICEFGERILWFVPKRIRHRLDQHGATAVP